MVAVLGSFISTKFAVLVLSPISLTALEEEVLLTATILKMLVYGAQVKRQQIAPTGMFGWWMVRLTLKGELKFATITDGGQFARITGASRMLSLFANSLDTRVHNM